MNTARTNPAIPRTGALAGARALRPGRSPGGGGGDFLRRGWRQLMPATTLLLIVSLAGMARAQQFTGTPPPNAQEVLDQVRFDQIPGAQVPTDDTFRDDAGKAVRLRDYLTGRPVVLALVYFRCPMLCTMVLNNAVESIKKLPLTPGQDFQVVFVSISPKETPQLAADKKANYLKLYGRPQTADGWHFLTGSESSIKPLADAIGYHYAYDPTTDQYAHPSGLVVLTPQGRVSRYFYGIVYPPQSLRLSLAEAGGGTIGSRVLQVLLRCYQFDPSTGKYTLVVMRVLRLLGVLTLATMGGGIGFLVWLERRQRRRTAAGPAVAKAG